MFIAKNFHGIVTDRIETIAEFEVWFEDYENLEGVAEIYVLDNRIDDNLIELSYDQLQNVLAFLKWEAERE